MRAGFLSMLALVISVVQAAPVDDHKRALEIANLEKRYRPLNDINCKLSKEHPVPLVLVHSTLPTSILNWAYHGTRFQMKNYCVFQFDYGQVSEAPGVGGMNYIENSALELDAFVKKVLDAMKVPKVDLLGHSQGGLMPIYWMKRLGGADKVRRFGALAPATHGTDLSGLVTLAKTAGIFNSISESINTWCRACSQMIYDSKFLADLYKDGDTVPGVEYFFLATKYDEVVTPPQRSFLQDENPLVKNRLIQEYCPLDFSEHVSIAFNPLAFNILDDFFTPSPYYRRLNCFTYFSK